MSFNTKTTKIFVGVDVSKATLDVYHPEKNEVVQIDNSDEAIGGLCCELEKKKRQIMVVMEGTGGYEYLLVKHLASHKIEAAVINPRRIRDFAKGIGMDAKTDPIDAQVISKYAEVVVPKPIATKSDHELKHGALVARRNQLLELINQENNLLTQSWDGAWRLIRKRPRQPVWWAMASGLRPDLAFAWRPRCDGLARFACDPLFDAFPLLDTLAPLPDGLLSTRPVPIVNSPSRLPASGPSRPSNTSKRQGDDASHC
jgi:hypothetical protein